MNRRSAFAPGVRLRPAATPGARTFSAAGVGALPVAQARAGFALITILWLVAVTSGMVGFTLAATRVSNQASVNRILLARGRWGAEACAAIVQARWRDRERADTATIDLGRETRCRWRVADPTARLHVNTTDSVVLVRLLGDARAADVLERRRHAAFVSDSELGAAAAVLTVEGPGTVNANAAPAPVLRALPGLGPEAVERLAADRVAGRPLGSLDALAAALSPSSREALLGHYPELARMLTFTAPQLIITAQGWVHSRSPDALVATIELLVVTLPERLAVIRRRMRG